MSSFPLVSFLVTLLLAAAVCTHGEHFVIDTAGNTVHTDEQYFIQPINTNGGGLVPAAVKLLPICPLGINQALLPHQPGLPASFGFPYPIMQKDVPTGAAVTIEFKSDIWPICGEFSKFWEVDESSSAAKEPAILVGGERRERNSWFKIERDEQVVGYVYKLTTLTGNVGTIPGPWGSAPQLVVANGTAKPLLVQFKKVDDATTAAAATTTTSRVEKLGLRMFPFY